VPEKRQTGRERIDIEAALHALLDVGETIGQRESQLLRRGRARFTNVIAGDRNGIPLWDAAGGELDQVDDDPQRGARWEAPTLLGDVLLQDVVLNGAAQALAR